LNTMVKPIQLPTSLMRSKKATTGNFKDDYDEKD
jgi:hypothetical protein